MLRRINNLIHSYTYSAKLDPKKIPAKLVLEGFGEVEYQVSRVDTFGGGQTRIIADDPDRKMYFVPRDTPARAPAARAAGMNMVERGQAVICLFAAAFGASIATAGVMLGNPVYVFMGSLLLLVSMMSLFPDRDQPPALNPRREYTP